ncbi:MAG: SUMF1/EgtB/PvdO family nonheme iron enzyme [Magnetococcales bacterium]|nr:SUMF1/EgtB/PvdO family nonheme iron enzyme [Magnetococcales bacterium]
MNASTPEKPWPEISLAAAARLIGHFTPGYRIVRSLGRGTYGEVFLAEDDLKKMAVKIIPLTLRNPDQPDGPPTHREQTSRDWVQIKTNWERLHHASLVRLRDYFLFHETDPAAQVTLYGLLYMDYWPWKLKGCIRHLLEEKRYTPVRRRALLVNLAASLHRLRQETGLLVTDLKPDNILLSLCHHGPLVPGFIDVGGLFRDGAADYPRADTTDGYLAPELADNQSQIVDEPALIYSFGLIGFFILEGRRPFPEVAFTGPFHKAFRQHHGLDWSTEVRQTLPGCVAILERCLRENPQERFPDFAALVTALHQEQTLFLNQVQRANISLVQATLPRTLHPAPGTLWREPVTGLELVWIPPGSFMMGQTEAEKKYLQATLGEEKYLDWFAHETPRHRVELDGFWLGRTPVTRGQFARFVEENLHLTDAQKNGFATGSGKNGWGEQKFYSWLQPGFAQDDAHPAVCISWFDALEFATWLSHNSGMTCTLPSEAQWEYACRAGTETPFHFGPTLHTDICNYDGRGVYDAGQKGENRQGTTPVGMFPANAFGVYDMHGNVWEWCLDCFDSRMYAQPSATEKNPLCPSRNPYRVRRGGAWSFGPVYLRAGYRGRNHPDHSSADGGFRLVATFAHGQPAPAHGQPVP